MLERSGTQMTFSISFDEYVIDSKTKVFDIEQKDSLHSEIFEEQYGI